MQASRGQAIYRLMVDKGEKLYQRAKQGRAPLIRDHKLMLRSVPRCFTGAEFVSWLVEMIEVGKEDEAVILGQHLLENGIIHHSEQLFLPGRPTSRGCHTDHRTRVSWDCVVV